MSLEQASPKLKADREVVLVAVKQDGNALEWASPELRNDREVVLEAMNQDVYLKCDTEEFGIPLKWASPELKNDREIVLVAATKSIRALEYASEEMQKYFKENGGVEGVLKIVKNEQSHTYKTDKNLFDRIRSVLDVFIKPENKSSSPKIK